jgi:hypothetical protein
LNGLDELRVLGQHEVDRGSLSAEAARSADSVDVVLLLVGQLVVDDKAHLLYVETSGEQVGRDEDSNGAASKILHDDVSLELVHLSVHDADSEVVISHRLLKLLNSLFGVTVDQSLVNVQVSVQREKDFHLPLFFLNSDVVLVDAFKGKLLVLNKDFCGVTHEVLGHREDFVGQGWGEESDLDVAGQELEDVLNLLLEAAGEQYVGLVEHEDLEVIGLEEAALHHVVDPDGGADDDVGAARLELLYVIFDDGAADACLHLDLHELADGVDDLGDLHGALAGGRNDEGLQVVRGGTLGVGVDGLEHADGER